MRKVIDSPTNLNLWVCPLLSLLQILCSLFVNEFHSCCSDILICARCTSWLCGTLPHQKIMAHWEEKIAGN